MVVQSFLGTWPFFNVLILYTVGRTPWTGEQPVSRPLPTQRTTQTQTKRTQTSMPREGFEPIIPAFERAKTGRALDRADTVSGIVTNIYMDVRSTYVHSDISLKYFFVLIPRSLLLKSIYIVNVFTHRRCMFVTTIVFLRTHLPGPRR
jgi:hypothetical protein